VLFSRFFPAREEEFTFEVFEMDSSEKWLSVKEVSARWGWSVDTIRRMIYRGILKAIILPQAGRRKRIYRSARIAMSEVERIEKTLRWAGR